MPRLSTRPLRSTSLLTPAVALLHVLLAPYSKVEESFSTQAAHDILVHGVAPAALVRYDHVVFPGAVPRSFLGPLVLAVITYPFAALGQALGLVRTSADVQVVMRCGLVLLTVKSLASFANALFTPPKLTQREAWIHRACFDVITACQFHFLFWASRTTPNSIALPFVLYAFKQVASLPNSQPRFLRGITSLTFLASTLRLELVGFLIPACTLFLAGVGSGAPNKTVRLARLLRAGVIGGLAGAAASITVDTYFWRGPQALLEPRAWLWPELSGLLFNVVEGKSSEWGISPWHTYLTSSIPKLLSVTSFFLIWTVITRLQPQADRKGKAKSVPTVNKRLPNMTPIRWLLALCAGHVGLLSLLGHKEWRFIVYTVPCFNAGSALGLRRCLTTRPRQIIALLVLGLTAAITALLTLISHVNYPGGHALAELERQLGSPPWSSTGRVRVHIDVFPAMTGVTLFQSLRLDRGGASGAFRATFLPSAVPNLAEQPSRIIEYDKTEGIGRDVGNATSIEQWSSYDILLTDRPECRIFDQASADASPIETSLDLFQPLFKVQAYSGVAIRRPKAYIQGLLYPHGDFWRHLLGRDAEDEERQYIGLSRWWRATTALLPIQIKTAPVITVCRRIRP
ncbi:alpha-1,6- mannosyltransferase [Tilletia horrida]|uniref:Mannosyltransferase n=1 Tax=Tilletia horrida TaxID=155126 RepID=A0AAN6G6Z4_9BASI|nr:alpha-1,6- mannosyltransferase [Tilletia horrida]